MIWLAAACICVSVCGVRELPMCRNSQPFFIIFVFMFVGLRRNGVFYDFRHRPSLLVGMRQYGVPIGSCLPLGLLCNI